MLNVAIERNFCNMAIKNAKRVEDAIGSDQIVLAGDGCNLKVERGALVLTHGSTHIPRTNLKTILNKGTHVTKSIVVISETGYVTLDAMSWCNNQEISLVVMSVTGTLVFANTFTNANVTLRRKQYGVTEEQSLHISEELVIRKTWGQIVTLDKLNLDGSEMPKR